MAVKENRGDIVFSAPHHTGPGEPQLRHSWAKLAGIPAPVLARAENAGGIGSGTAADRTGGSRTAERLGGSVYGEPLGGTGKFDVFSLTPLEAMEVLPAGVTRPRKKEGTVMARIHVLDAVTANQIAAGEVVVSAGIDCEGIGGKRHRCRRNRN